MRAGWVGEPVADEGEVVAEAGNSCVAWVLVAVEADGVWRCRCVRLVCGALRADGCGEDEKSGERGGCGSHLTIFDAA